MKCNVNERAHNVGIEGDFWFWHCRNCCRVSFFLVSFQTLLFTFDEEVVSEVVVRYVGDWSCILVGHFSRTEVIPLRVAVVVSVYRKSI